jgi:hypothetical protein
MQGLFFCLFVCLFGRVKNFLHGIYNRSGAHPASCPMDFEGSLPEVKRSEREAEHSSPTNANVLLAECLVKHEDFAVI